MSEAKHTPGPWKYEVHELSEGFSAIVYGSTTGLRIGTDHLSEADARLIAAAPDLLAMIKRLVEVNAEFRAGLPADWEGDPMDDACKEAAALIAKAEGRT